MDTFDIISKLSQEEIESIGEDCMSVLKHPLDQAAFIKAIMDCASEDALKEYYISQISASQYLNTIKNFDTDDLRLELESRGFFDNYE